MNRLFTVLVACIALMAATVLPTQHADAQVAYQFPVVAGDTVINTATLTKIMQFTDGYAGITITPVATNVTGTMAGKIRCLRSNNGTDYTAVDSLAIATGTQRQWKDFSFTAPVPAYVKIEFIGSGTVTYKTELWRLLRRTAGLK